MTGTIGVLVPDEKANPGPPFGPKLGPTPADVQGAVNDINDQTAAFDGMEVLVTAEYDDDGSFSIEVGVPPTAALIKDEIGFDTDSGGPQENSVADMPIEQLKRVTERKSSDLLSYDLKNASKEVAGACASLGVTIKGGGARTFKQRIGGGDFDDCFDDE